VWCGCGLQSFGGLILHGTAAVDRSVSVTFGPLYWLSSVHTSWCRLGHASVRCSSSFVCDALGPGGEAEFEFGSSGKSRGKIAYIYRWISDVS